MKAMCAYRAELAPEALFDVAGARVLARWARDLAARGLALDRIAPVTFAGPRP